MLKEEQFRDEAGLMLLCAGVLQPITGGKGTKRDQTPFLAQHTELGTGTEMFMAPAQGSRAVLSQQMWDRSTGSAQHHHLPVPRTPPQPYLVFPCGTGKVSQGSLCPCPEPDEMMMTVAAQLQPGGSGRAFPQAGVRNSFCPS